MKNILIAAILTTGVLALPALAQDKLPREEALKYALVACGNLKEMLNTPIPTDPDVKRPVVVRDGDYGGMLLPSRGQASIFRVSVDSGSRSWQSRTMPRQIRHQYSGAMYHVMSRGNRRADIYLDDMDRVMGEHGLPEDTAETRQEFEGRMEAARLQPGDEEGLSAGRRRFRLSRSRSACTLAPPRARAFVCSQSGEHKPQLTRRSAS